MRRIALVFVVAVVPVVLTGKVFGESSLAIVAPSDIESGGGSFAVGISVDSIADLAGYQVELEFVRNNTPISGITLIDSDEGDILPTQGTYYGDLDSGRYSVLLAGDATGDGYLCWFNFQYDVTVTSSFTILPRNIVLGKRDGSTIVYSINPRVVTVDEDQADTSTYGSDPITPTSMLVEGDATVNGLVDVMDLIYITNHLGNYEPVSHADQYQDSWIDTSDLDYVVERIGEFTPRLPHHIFFSTTHPNLYTRWGCYAVGFSEYAFPLVIVYNPADGPYTIELETQFIGEGEPFPMQPTPSGTPTEWSMDYFFSAGGDSLAQTRLEFPPDAPPQLVIDGEWDYDAEYATVFVGGKQAGDSVNNYVYGVVWVARADFTFVPEHHNLGNQTLLEPGVIGTTAIISMHAPLLSVSQAPPFWMTYDKDLFSISINYGGQWQNLPSGQTLGWMQEQYDLKIEVNEKDEAWGAEIEFLVDNQRPDNETCLKLAHSALKILIVPVGPQISQDPDVIDIYKNTIHTYDENEGFSPPQFARGNVLYAGHGVYDCQFVSGGVLTFSVMAGDPPGAVKLFKEEPTDGGPIPPEVREGEYLESLGQWETENPDGFFIKGLKEGNVTLLAEASAPGVYGEANSKIEKNLH